MKQLATGILDSYNLNISHYDEVFKESKVPKDHYQTIVSFAI